MRRIGWGRRLRASLKDAGHTRVGRPAIVAFLLEGGAQDLGAQAADIFWAGTKARFDVPEDVRADAALSISGEVDNAINSILREWRIPRSAESERMADAAEAAFRKRLDVLTGRAGDAI